MPALIATTHTLPDDNNMRTFLVVSAVIASLALASPASGAEADPPDVLLKALTSEIRAAMTQDHDIRARDPAKIAHLIETKVLPFFDFRRMTQMAMARNWRLATAEQQNALISEFQTLLVRTYAAALQNYRNQTVEFKALDAKPGDVEVTVKSLLKETGVDPLPIDYQMARTPAGWKVYEITFDGINLIANYRSVFETRVRSGGVDGLIKALREKNRSSDPT